MSASHGRTPLLGDAELNGTNLHGLNARSLRVRRLTTVYVYEAPVRLWHWTSAASILVLAVTGYLIGSPPASLSGEASAHFQMGWIRYLHFVAAYVFAIGFIGRIVWGFVGNIYSREIFFLPFWQKQYWRDLLEEVKVYAFLTRQARTVVGHNALGRTAMFFCVTLLGAFMIASGFALYSEGTGIDSWQGKLFGWVLPLLGGSLSTHFWHHLGMWGMLLFVMIHVYTVIHGDITSRQSLMSAMISGYRSFRDDRPD